MITRMWKWIALPALVIAGMMLATSDAKAQGFGISVYRSYGAYPYTVGYGSPYSPYGGYYSYGYGYNPYVTPYTAYRPYYRSYTSYYVAPPVYYHRHHHHHHHRPHCY